MNAASAYIVDDDINDQEVLKEIWKDLGGNGFFIKDNNQ